MKKEREKKASSLGILASCSLQGQRDLNYIIEYDFFYFFERGDVH